MGTVVSPKEFSRRSAPLATPGALPIVGSPLRVEDSVTATGMHLTMQTKWARSVVSRTPEFIRGLLYGFEVDWWCFGAMLIMLHEILTPILTSIAMKVQTFKLQASRLTNVRPPRMVSIAKNAKKIIYDRFYYTT